eukprot:gene8286-5805_t
MFIYFFSTTSSFPLHYCLPMPRHIKKKIASKAAQAAAESPQQWEPPPPVETIQAAPKTFHGTQIVDHYAWLEDRGSSRVKRVLERENAYVEGFFQQHHPTLRRELFQEMKRRWKENETSVPTIDGPFWYYTRHVPNAEYGIYCRRPYSPATAAFVEDLVVFWRSDPLGDLPFFEDEQIFLDPNLLLKELRVETLELGDLDISPDHTKVALMVDLTSGKEVHTLLIIQIKDINYRCWLHAHAPAAISQYWANQARGDESMYDVLEISSPHGSPITPMGSSSGSRKTLFGPVSSMTKRGNQPTKARANSSKELSSSSSREERDLLPLPKHKILHRIDQFEMGAEVCWANDTAVLYLGLDDAMRPYQLVYHDLNTTPDDNPLATVVCYEEQDEAFWIGSLCTTADERFFLFQSASSDTTEWFVAPMTPREPRDALGQATELIGVPLVPSAVLASGNGEEGGADGRPLAAVTCARPRHARDELGQSIEYDLEHHEALLGPSLGAWVVRSNCGGRSNFALWCLPEREGADSAGLETAAGSLSRWIPLLAYDPMIKVESVDCLRELLLVSVRRHGIATTLLCPVVLVWRWWGAQQRGDDRVVEPLALDQLLDTSALLRPIAARATVSPGMDEVDVAAEIIQQGSEAAWRSRPDVAGVPLPCGPSEIRTSSLPLTVECYPEATSFDCRVCRASLTHFLRPHQLYELRYEPPDDATRLSGGLGRIAVQLLREEVVRGSYDAAAYDGALVWVPSNYYATSVGRGSRPSADLVPTKAPASRVDVPVYLLWRRDVHRPGTNPLLVHVYGSYGDCGDTDFASERLSLLDRGFMWGTAAVRGGGEFGTAWRDEGRRLQRGTTVNDFLSVVQYVQEMRICAPGKVVSCGGSAGGFVVCRAMNAAPHLFHAVIGAAPFVDCLSTLLRADLPLTVTEWEEFGNPVQDSDAFHLLRALSPVNTLPPPSSATVLPHIFLETSWNDFRVGYWESLKFVAHLRAWMAASQQPPSTSIALHLCHLKSGHDGAAGRYQQLRELAAEYAFALLIVSQPEYFQLRSGQPYVIPDARGTDSFYATRTYFTASRKEKQQQQQKRKGKKKVINCVVLVLTSSPLSALCQRHAVPSATTISVTPFFLKSNKKRYQGEGA